MQCRLLGDTMTNLGADQVLSQNVMGLLLENHHTKHRLRLGCMIGERVVPLAPEKPILIGSG
jgi:hypothetical protein